MKLLTALLIAALVSTGAYGIIIDGFGMTRPRDHGAGEFVKIADPNGLTVGQDNFNSPNLYGFDERQGVSYEGTVYNSHYVFFDPETRGVNDGYNMQGWVEFDSPILSIIEDRSAQMMNDETFGLASVTYWYPTLIGLEPGNRAFVDPDNPNRMLWDTDASTPGDWIRVLTSGENPTEVVSDTGSSAILATVGLFSVLFASRFGRRYGKGE